MKTYVIATMKIVAMKTNTVDCFILNVSITWIRFTIKWCILMYPQAFITIFFSRKKSKNVWNFLTVIITEQKKLIKKLFHSKSSKYSHQENIELFQTHQKCSLFRFLAKNINTLTIWYQPFLLFHMAKGKYCNRSKKLCSKLNFYPF